MALADHYTPADILDSLVWMSLPYKARIAKLAHTFLLNEKDIEKHSRTYNGASKSNVTTLMRSLFEPPRGRASTTVADTLVEIDRQRKIRDKRAANKPYSPPTPPPDDSAFLRKRRIIKRLNNIAARRYKITYTGYDKKKYRAETNAVCIGSIVDCVMIADAGAHAVKGRIYLRHKPTGQELVLMLDGSCTSYSDIHEFLFYIAPKVSLRGLFSGKSLVLDFERRGFVVDGVCHPWRNILATYTAKHGGVIRTPRSLSD
ncbi:MAG: hypothetical protein AB7L09_02130 [Nitrospira sp.]